MFIYTFSVLRSPIIFIIILSTIFSAFIVIIYIDYLSDLALK